MGTRSNTKIIDVEHSFEPHDTEWDKPEVLINLYRQFDGYPGGHGKELFGFLDGMSVTSRLVREGKAAYGAGCLAAQLVAFFKKESGQFYLEHVDSGGNDYTYTVRASTRDIVVEVHRHAEQVFNGTVEDFGKFCEADV